MTFLEYRKTHSWQEAIALGPHLAQIAEQLPKSEHIGLAARLHEIALELPTAVAYDLFVGGDHRFEVFLRLTAALELVETIYPALDTAEAATAAEQLGQRLVSNQFTELVPGPAAPASAPTEDEELDAPESENEDTPAAPEDTQETHTVHVQPHSLQ